MFASNQKRQDNKPISAFSKKDVEELIEKYGPAVAGITLYVISVGMLSMMLVAFGSAFMFTLAFITTWHPLYFTGLVLSLVCALFPVSVAYTLINWKHYKKMFRADKN